MFPNYSGWFGLWSLVLDMFGDTFVHLEGMTVCFTVYTFLHAYVFIIF